VQAGPSPRAFHVAVVIDCNMFVFGGRSGGKRSPQLSVYYSFAGVSHCLSLAYVPVFASQVRGFLDARHR
jgi:hypothetical protein